MPRPPPSGPRDRMNRMIGVDRPHEGSDRGTASPLCSIGAGRTVPHIRPGPALGRSARLCKYSPALNGVEILPCADGPPLHMEKITVTSTIRTSPGITRKARHRPARALLSRVQYPSNRPENDPTRPMRTPSEILTWELGPARTFTGGHDPPTRPTSSLHQGGLGHRAFLTRRLLSPRASAPGE